MDRHWSQFNSYDVFIKNIQKRAVGDAWFYFHNIIQYNSMKSMVSKMTTPTCLNHSPGLLTHPTPHSLNHFLWGDRYFLFIKIPKSRMDMTVVFISSLLTSFWAHLCCFLAHYGILSTHSWRGAGGVSMCAATPLCVGLSDFDVVRYLHCGVGVSAHTCCCCCCPLCPTSQLHWLL